MKKLFVTVCVLLVLGGIFFSIDKFYFKNLCSENLINKIYAKSSYRKFAKKRPKSLAVDNIFKKTLEFSQSPSITTLSISPTIKPTNSSNVTPNRTSTVSPSRKLIWGDEFNSGSGLDSNSWRYDIGGDGWGNNELQCYTNETKNCKIVNGNLVITALKESYNSNEYTSARVLTQGKREWTYGYFEARIKIPQGKGTWPAFWLLGSTINNGSQYSEIDIMEHVNHEDEIYGSAHWCVNNLTSKTKASKLTNKDDYHLYALNWSKNSISWYVDNKKYNEISITDQNMSELHKASFLILNLAIGGKWPKEPDGTTDFPVSMYVDYVHVYTN